DRIAEQPRIESLLAPDQVVPGDRRFVIEPEAPVWRAAFRHGRVGGLALIDRRQAAPEQHLAAKLELVGSLVAGIGPAGCLQPLEFALVEIEPLRLTDDLVARQTEPLEVIADGPVELLRRALAVGVVDPQDEFAAALPREEEIV